RRRGARESKKSGNDAGNDSVDLHNKSTERHVRHPWMYSGSLTTSVSLRQPLPKSQNPLSMYVFRHTRGTLMYEATKDIVAVSRSFDTRMSASGRGSTCTRKPSRRRKVVSA